jgi:type I restriction enzyme R subunit
LTGFDAPRNTVLYLAKPLKGHNLLQAIARVNRLFEGKEYGHIIDYVGVLGKLDEALTEYSALEDFDEEDLKNTVVDIKDEIRKVPIRHAEVWDIFNGVYNKTDIEALERHISEKDVRDQFYERVSAFARLLQTALASDDFYIEFNMEQIGFYKSELKKFQSLRLSVQFRYAEKVSYKEYEPRVRKLLDTYINADEIQVLTRDINIFDKDMVEEALETYGKTPASKADFIAHQMKKVVTESMEKDEAFYKKFSELIEEIIKDFYDGRLTEKEYLEAMQKTRDDLASGYQDGIPDSLQNNPRARAFYGALNEVLNKKLDKEISKNKVAEAGLEIEEIVNNLIITDWKKNVDIQNRMENQIEDYLIGKRSQLGIEISFDEIDAILIKCLRVAKNNF